MTNEVFKYQSYRELILDLLRQKTKKLGREISLTSLAEACQIQRTYLSAVLHGRGDLSADQIFSVSQFFQLKEDECEYLHTLHEYERSGLQSRKRALVTKLFILREKGQRVDKKLTLNSPKNTMTSALQDFYLDPYCQLIHMFIALPKFQNRLEHIRRHLGLSIEKFDQCTQTLLKAGLVELTTTGARYLSEPMHLPSESPLYGQYRDRRRQLGLSLLQKSTTSQQKQFTFSVFYSASSKTRSRVHELFLEFISQVKELAGEEEASEVYQINFDLLHWSF